MKNKTILNRKNNLSKSPFDGGPSFAGASIVKTTGKMELKQMSMKQTRSTKLHLLANNGSKRSSRSSNVHELKVCYFNARSIVNKVVYLENLLKTSEYDLVLIVETWMKENLPDALVTPNGYNITRRDRIGRNGGGLMVLNKTSCTVVEIRLTDAEFFEYLCVDMISYASKTTLRFYCIYVPPDISQNSDAINLLCKSLTIHKLNTDYFYIIGDLNMPSIDWKDSTAVTRTGKIFLNFCISNSQNQLITEPTTTSGSLLDLFICDPVSENLLQQIEVEPPLCLTCDHHVISFKINHFWLKEKEKFTYLCYQRGNYQFMFNELVLIDWNSVFANCDNNIQRIYDYFVESVQLVMRKYIPKKKFKMNPRKSKEVTKLAKKKKTLYHKTKTDSSIKEEYKKVSKAYDLEVKSWNDRIEQKICDTGNKSAFYKFVNKKLRMRSSIPPIKLDNQQLIIDDLEKAEHFNKVFTQVFLNDNDDSNDQSAERGSLLQSHTRNCLEDIVISESEVEFVLRHIRPKTSKTPEGIPAFVIKKIGPAVINFLVRFFNLSIQSGCIPEQWKTSIISPIHKKGSKSAATNYRPISLTSILCRILETIIKDRIIKHLFDNNLISNNQHGFFPRRSTLTHLLNTTNEWTHKFDQNKETNVVYTDFRKAFDKVSHKLLLKTVYSFEIKSKVLNWIKCFLGNRTQQVIIGTSISSPQPVTSGVPQGSVLGPILFNLFIDHISDVCVSDCNITLFADDSKLHSTNDVSLQRSLNNFESFVSHRKLSLAHEKCRHLQISKTKSDKYFLLNNEKITKCDHINDLGINVSRDLKWKIHISTIRKRAFNNSYFIFRSFNSQNVWILLEAFKVYVRPILEYNSPIYNPYLIEDIKKLEEVQKYFTKTLCKRCNIKTTSYDQRLEILNLKTLQYRRVTFDLILTYKIIHNLIDLEVKDFFTFQKSRYNLRRHSQCLVLPKYNGNVRGNFFSHRIIRTWNALPNEIVSSATLDSFKSRLKKFDITSIYNFQNFN